MQVRIDELRPLLEAALTRRNCSAEEAAFVADYYLEAELSGKTTHGVLRFCNELAHVAERQGRPRTVVDTPQMVLVDARREIGPLAARLASKLVVERARRHGLAVVGLKNMQRYGALSRWARMIAESDLIGMVANSCEPAVPPFGGTAPVLGTNPIAIGVPTSSDPILVDMATSKASMSVLLRSRHFGAPLPGATFLDAAGNYTTSEDDVAAVEPFGGYKGYALGLFVEVLSGSLLTAGMGSRIASPYDIGYFFLAIDPSAFQDIEEFKRRNDELLEELKASPPVSGTGAITVPGDRGRRNMKASLRRGSIQVPDHLYGVLLHDGAS